MGVLALLMLLRQGQSRTISFTGAIGEMRDQTTSFTSTWSRKARNAALLRYYILMVVACGRLGIRDAPSETPREFIDRAAAELGVDVEGASRFADAVDKAHYGKDLSIREADGVKDLMDSFAHDIQRRAAVG